MIPLRDNIPSRAAPVVNYVMVGLCTAAFLGQLSEGRDPDASLVERYGMIPYRVFHPRERIDIKVAVETPSGPQYLIRPAASPPFNPWLTLITEAEERLREETRIAETLHQIGGILAAELDLDRLVQVITEEATKLANAEYGALFYLVDGPDGEDYMLHALSGAPREAFEKFPTPRATALLGATFTQGQVVRASDVTADPRFGNNSPHRGMPDGHLPVCSYLGVPVVARSGAVLGGLFFAHSEPGRFTARHERLIVGVAGQAAIAIDNARLFQQTQETEAALRAEQAFLSQLYELQENERKLVAYDLHDGVVQYVTAALMHLESMREAVQHEDDQDNLDTAVQLLRRSVEEGRDLINGIRPPVLDECPIVTAIEHLIDRQLNARDRVEYSPVSDFPRLEPTLETTIYRIAQEALTNALQHSDSPRVRVSLEHADGMLRFEVRDWGLGFDPDRIPEDRYGLKGIRDRVNLLGGQLTLATAPGEGVCIVVEAPAEEAT